MFKKVLLCLIGTLVISSINILNAEQKNDNQEIPVLVENNGNIGLNNINNIDAENNNNNNENQILEHILQTSWESLLGRFNFSNQKIMEYIKSNELLSCINKCLQNSKNFDPDDIIFDNINDIIDFNTMEERITQRKHAIEHHSVQNITEGIWNEIPLVFKEDISEDIQKIIKNRMFHYLPKELRCYDITPSIHNNDFYFQCIFPHEFVILPNNSITYEESLCLLTLSIKMDLLTNDTPNTNTNLLAKYLLKLYQNSPDNIQQEINRYKKYFTNGENATLNNLLRNYYNSSINNDAHNLANYF